MAVVLVKSYHWLNNKRHAQLTCWSCHRAMGVVAMPELQAIACSPGLPVVCFSCDAKPTAPQGPAQLELFEVLERIPSSASGSA